MTNTTKLKKGTPPQRLKEQREMLADTRPEETKNRPLQLMVSHQVFQEFSAKAGLQFGFEKGAKSKLFIEMWKLYQSHVNN